jgi:membrane-associated phospholipid phosphatase
MPEPAWTADLAHRMRHFWWLKFLGVCAFMWLFFTAYFHLLRHPAFEVTVMPVTALDHAIPFQAAWLGPYLSLWLYTGIAPGLMLQLRELVIYGLWASALCGAGLICFYFWPTAVPPSTIDVSAYPGFQLLRGVDAGGNACPSLHVATAVFSALWIQRLLQTLHAPKWLRGVNVIWAAAIVYSTVAVRQHVVIDALAGAMLGGLFAAFSLWLTPSASFSTPAGRPTLKLI